MLVHIGSKWIAITIKIKITIAIIGAVVFYSISVFSNDVYKWTDENGHIHYGDTQPPQNRSKRIEVIAHEPDPEYEQIIRSEQEYLREIDRRKRPKPTGKKNKRKKKTSLREQVKQDIRKSLPQTYRKR